MDRQDRPDPDERWLVPKQDYFGTEIKLSHEFMTGMLRAAGGTLTWTDGDMLRTLNSRIEMMYYADPKRYVIRLVEDDDDDSSVRNRDDRGRNQGG